MSAEPDERKPERTLSAAAPRALDPAAEHLERLAGQRQRLQHLAGDLAQSLDPAAVASRIIDAACGLLQAPRGWVAVVSEDGRYAEVLGSLGYGPAEVAPWTRVPLELDTPMTVAIREARTIVHESMAARHAAYPAVASAGGGIPTEASAVIPLQFEGRTTGALAVGWTESRGLDEDEIWFLESLAAQGSQGLERARLFAAVQEREERLRFALEASNTGTWSWDIQANRLEWSSEVSSLHGTEPGWAPPTFEAYLGIIHPDDRERVVAAIETAARDGSQYDEEFRVLRPDGSHLWIRGAGRVTLDEAGRPIRMTGTTSDITVRKEAEAERDRFLEAEREASRLRDAFIGVVSHELRTPITTIFGGTRVLARRWREMPEAARDEILSDVVEEADRLYRLVEDLLVLTRVERGTLEMGDEPIHLGRLLQRVVTSERGRWPEVRFVMDVAAGLPTVTGEDTYLEQILRNLIGNAAKYGGPGTTVTVVATADARAVTLTVLDEGPGVDEAEHDALFDLFYRSPAVAGTVTGAGIGLFVCRQLVAAMGGTIRAHRRPEGGSAFVVTLPRYGDDESA